MKKTRIKPAAKKPSKRPAWPTPRPVSAPPPLANRPPFVDTLLQKAKVQP